MNVLLFLIGTCFGSFISMYTHRVERPYTFYDSSMCPICLHRLEAVNLIPLLSYIMQAGKCSVCGHGISSRYPMIELITGILFVIVYNAVDSFELSVILYALCVLLMIIAVIDIERYIIIDEHALALLMLGLLYSLFTSYALLQLLFIMITLTSLFLLLRFIFLRLHDYDALGIGDIKLFACAAPFLSLDYVSYFLFCTGAIGFVFGIAWKNVYGHKRFPFAPAICISLLLNILLANQVSVF